MRKFYFLLAVSFLAINVHAQINKGSILLGGQVAYSNSKRNNQKAPAGNIGFSIGNAFKENRVSGLTLNFSTNRQFYNYNGIDTTSVQSNFFGAGVFQRRYKKLAKDFYFFGQLDASVYTSDYTESFQTSTSGTIKTTYRGAAISLSPGLSFQVLSKLQMEVTIPGLLSLGYSVTKNGNISKTKQFAFNAGTSNGGNLGYLGIGFRFVL